MLRQQSTSYTIIIHPLLMFLVASDAVSSSSCSSKAGDMPSSHLLPYSYFSCRASLYAACRHAKSMQSMSPAFLASPEAVFDTHSYRAVYLPLFIYVSKPHQWSLKAQLSHHASFFVWSRLSHCVFTIKSCTLAIWTVGLSVTGISVPFTSGLCSLVHGWILPCIRPNCGELC